MILDPDALSAAGLAAFPTLDDLFRRAAARQGDAVALCDPPDRMAITGEPPRRLTYAEADRTVGAIAARLRDIGLPTDAVIATQLPNTVESVLMLLGIWRAGMIVAPLPMLWRAEEIAAAVECSGISALITAARIGKTPQLAVAMQAAAACFPIRHVGVFGPNDGDGVVSFDAVFDAAPTSIPNFSTARRDHAAAHTALLNFEMTAAGPVPLARSHLQVLAAAPALAAAGMLEKDGAILSAVPLASFAGVVLGLVNWLFNGGTLVLHHPFDADAFAAQCRAHRCATVVLPGPVVPALAEAELLAHRNGLRRVAALWRSASQWRGAPRFAQQAAPRLIDLLALGEFAISAAPRAPDGIPDPAALTIAGDHPSLTLARTRNDTLALRGAMLPAAAFPPGAMPAFARDADGFLDTGLALRPGDDSTAIPLDQRVGLTRIGGYALRAADIERLVAAADPYATVAVLPHGLTGSRLAGTSAQPAAVIEALAAVNPLLGAAFIPRRGSAPEVAPEVAAPAPQA